MRANRPQRIPLKLALTLLQRLPSTQAGRVPLRGTAKLLPAQRQSSEQGLSLIECLIAIVIIALTVVAILPPIMLATATRIQARRADQANQIAQGEVDRIRTIVERGSYYINQLPEAVATQNIRDAAPATVAPGAGNPIISPANCPNRYPASPTNPADPSTYPPPAPANGVILVDVEGDCTADYVMQVFRTTGRIPTGETVPYSFDIGVRVYTYFPGQPFPTLEKERASLITGTGPRDVIDGARRRPMAALYSSVARNDSGKSMGCIGTGATCSF